MAPSQTVQPNLFVLGCARSGTTVLQNALNDSGEVFLFGEPDFHRDPGTPDFASRYNAMHRAWNNQPTKSTFCPKLFEADAGWLAYLQKLSILYKLVGSKIVLDTGTLLSDPTSIFDFYCREFYGAHYVFTFRNPLAVADSVQQFLLFAGLESTPFDHLMAGFVEVLKLCILMLRNLPNVHIVFHDNMTHDTFADLERRLDVRLSNAHLYYDATKVRAFDPTPMLHDHGDRARLVLELYEYFHAAAIEGFELVQLEQNNSNPSPTHLTALGHLARRCEMIGAGLALGTIPGGAGAPSSEPQGPRHQAGMGE